MFLTTSAAKVVGQDLTFRIYHNSLDKYYPENKLIKQQKIKFIIDSSDFHLPTKVYIKGYDTLGRLIGEFNYDIKKFDNPFIYRKINDTLYRLRYRANTTELYSLEKFVYNKQGKILQYLICCDYYFKKDNFTVELEDFYYDQNILQSKLRYYKGDYNGIINEKIKIAATDLELTDAISYSYKIFKGNKIVIGKQNVGKQEWRETDTALLDKKNRIIKFNSFAKMASLGCPVGNNVNKVTEYKYSDTSLTITSYTTHCIAPLSDFKCFQYEKMNEDKTVIIFDKSNKKIKEYSIYNDGERKLVSRYFYLYYD